MPVHARIAVDPIHAALIDVPIVSYAATVAALAGHAITGGPAWYRAALCASVASVAIGLVAVVPAIADLVGLDASPRWRRLGFRHAACNVVALIAFSAAGAAICTDYARIHELDVTAPLVLASVGLAASLVSAWLGWTMIELLGASIASARMATGHELLMRVPTQRPAARQAARPTDG